MGNVAGAQGYGRLGAWALLQRCQQPRGSAAKGFDLHKRMKVHLSMVTISCKWRDTMCMPTKQGRQVELQVDHFNNLVCLKYNHMAKTQATQLLQTLELGGSCLLRQNFIIVTAFKHKGVNARENAPEPNIVAEKKESELRKIHAAEHTRLSQQVRIEKNTCS